MGRDGLAEHCFRTLQVKSLVLVSDRRMGKTWLLGKMGQEAAEGVIWLYIDTEYASSLGELFDRVCDAARDQLSLGARAFARTTELIQAVGGKGVGSFTVPAFKGLWKRTLSAILDDLCAHAEGKTVVLVMDEFPLFLHKLIESGADGAGHAMELCDVLRYFRQTLPPLRIVLAGSIGLHLVMDDLRSRGYHNAPFNDMETIEVPPLDRVWAEQLALRLLRGIEISAGEAELAAAIAREAECVPYFIHRIPFEMQKEAGREWAQTDVAALLRSLIADGTDPLSLDNYRDRIRKYYRNKDEQEAIYTLLDVLAERRGGTPIQDLFDTACAAHPQVGRSRMAELTEMLERDHYVRRQKAGGAYAFASNILRRWWVHRRKGVAGK